MGKHIDKLDADAAKGIHTLPILLASAWPLWFVASAVTFSRQFGILFLGDLILDTILQLLILPLFQRANSVCAVPGNQGYRQ